MNATTDNSTGQGSAGAASQNPISSDNTNFTQPRANQGYSRLLSLPAEIRVKIWQELLVADGPISRRTLYLVENKGVPLSNGPSITSYAVVRGYHLTPAILRTCQMLYTEARPTLYEDNTLRIDFTAGTVAYGERLTARPVCMARFTNPPSCQDCATMTTLDDELMTRKRCNMQLTVDPNVEEIAKRFRNIHFDAKFGVGVGGRVSMRLFLQRWNSFSAQRKITADISSPANVRDMYYVRFLYVFRLLRCRDFRFVNTQIVHYGHNLVEREVVGTSAAVDLLPAFRDICRMGTVLMSTFEPSTTNRRRALVQPRLLTMREAMELFDVQSFQRAARPIMALFDSEMAIVASAALARATEIARVIRNEEQGG